MPLLEKARIEIYLPDLPKKEYKQLLDAFDQEFTFTFGGATILHNLDGSYLSKFGQKINDRISLIYTDTPFSFEQHFQLISNYTDRLREAAFDSLQEEAILVVVLKVYHSV